MVYATSNPKCLNLLLPPSLKLKISHEDFIKLGWLIDPQNRRAEIYRQGREVEVLINPQTLSGEDVLPGFSLNLQRIWER